MPENRDDIVVVNGITTRRSVAECLASIIKDEVITFPASNEQVGHYLNVQHDQSNNI
jgi:hypothetical protein